ncbi:nitroreductase family protein [Clostridia bacterium]|nr:nitroreductase family protein [Clostridia bacterium]
MDKLRNLYYKRRSCRSFKEDKVSDEKIQLILEAALLAPAGRNRKPCHFLVVDDKETLLKLSVAKLHGSQLVEGASHAIVVMGDKTITDTWVEDASIATTFIQLMAEEIGLGSCWIQIRNRYYDKEETILSNDYLKKLLDISDNFEVLSMVALGYKKEETIGRSKDTLDWTQITHWSSL